MSLPFRAAAVAAACQAAALSFSLLPAAARAQSAPQPAQLALAASDTVVVTATRQPTRIDAQLSDVSVITRDEIEANPGRSLAEILGQQPGVDFIANGGLGKSSSVSIRGSDVRNVLLIIDGVRYGSPSLGQAAFENIPPEMIDHIEVVRGPLSSLYGADASGGVIQVFTRRGSSGFHPDASAGVGPHGYGQASVGAGFGQGPWSGAVQVQHLEDRGFSATNSHEPFGSYNPDADGFRQDSGTASLGYRFSPDWQASAHVLRSQGKTQFDDGPGADARARLTSETLSADVSGRVTGEWRSTLRAARSLDIYDTLASASPWTDLGPIRNEQQELSWENTVPTAAGSLLVLVEHLKQQVHKPDQDYDVTDRSIDGVALGLDGHSGPHTWQASVRHDRNSQFGSQDTGNLAYGYDVSPQWRLGAAAGTSFTAPSFNLLYWPGFGNPALQPERGRNRELSARWRPDERQQLTLTAYSNRVRDYITEANTNVPTAKLDGATLAWQAQLADWQLAASLDELRARDGDGQPLPRRARHALKLIADRHAGPLGYGLTVQARGARQDTSYDANFDPVPVTLDRYATLDLRAAWEFMPGLTLQAKLDNAFDKHYETAYGYNQPGRELYVTLRWAPK